MGAALRSLAQTDSLTSLPNRRGLNETLARVLPASTSERMTAVYLLDLDAGSRRSTTGSATTRAMRCRLPSRGDWSLCNAATPRRRRWAASCSKDSGAPSTLPARNAASA